MAFWSYICILVLMSHCGIFSSHDLYPKISFHLTILVSSCRVVFYSAFHSSLITQNWELRVSLSPLRDSLFSFVIWNSLVRNFLRSLSTLIFSLFWTLFHRKDSNLWLGHVPGIILDAHRKHTYLPLSLSAEVQWFRYSPLPLSELIKELGTSWCPLVPS